METHRRFCFPDASMRTHQALSKILALSSAVLTSMSCTSVSARPSSTPPEPTAVPSSPMTATARSGSWDFSYASGVLSYQVSRNATITGRIDSTDKREVSGNLVHETITLEGTDSLIRITAVIDSFATTTQGLIGAVQPVQLPVRTTGTMQPTGVSLSDTVSGSECSVVASVLKTDLNNLLIHFPPQLVSGSTWTDSVNVSGCQGGLPGASRIVRAFTVRGQMEVQGMPVVVVERVDTVSAHGEGAEQQHQVSFDATGTGGGKYFVDTTRGRVVRLTTEQRVVFSVIASGRTSSFTQVVQQDYRLVH
jgi:hypothetical protein